MTRLVTGRSLGLIVCTRCRATVRAIGAEQSTCPRCEAPLYVRRPHSLSTSAALVITAAVLYIPANVLPVMHTHEIFSDEDDTIMSGVISLAHQGSWPIALLVFFASMVVPLLKLVALGEILFAISRGRVRHTRQRSRLFRIVEFVGRWSMLDVFALSLLASLVQIQSLATIQIRPGAFAFAAVVVLTLLAAQTFDERLLWDADTRD
ncbi:MAG: paraquat-inducible protein A [Steroidobacteraceae bacterium]|jgi:paraquat-inducible protein A